MFSLQTAPRDPPLLGSIGRALGAMAGLAVPLALGSLMGRPEFGMAMGLGSLMLGAGREGRDRSTSARLLSLLLSALAGAAAMLVGSSLAGDELWRSLGLALVVAFVSLFGGMSRTLAQQASRFAVFALIASGLVDAEVAPWGLASLFLLGVVWTGLLSLLRPPSTGTGAGTGAGAECRNGREGRQPTARHLFRRWRATLVSLQGWQYPLRILICLAAAALLETVWPFRHAYWMAVTIAIVLPRRPETGVEKMLHRAMGTFLGVLLGGALMLAHLPVYGSILAIALFAAARPVVRSIHYAAYAAVHTPMILLLMDFGREPSLRLGLDRLAATMAGCAVVFLLGYLPWRKTESSLDRAESA